jgi:hypothetical protein
MSLDFGSATIFDTYEGASSDLYRHVPDAAKFGIRDDSVVWSPLPKQNDFLGCSDYEVLYGGAAGGGKSDALLIDGWCLQDGGPENKNHRAIVFRRSFPELKDLIARARELFPQFIPGIDYNQQTHTFTAPSGATFEFGYLQNDNDRFKYRGRAWNWIGFDELTLWSTDVCYLYLMSRNRTTDPTLPRYMRATTNPDGPGQHWVMKRWGIEEAGGAARVVKEVEFETLREGGNPDLDSGYEMVRRFLARSFIPAKLSDNRYLRGTGYRETLMELPETEQAQLLRGLWTGNNVQGAYYIAQMQKMRATGRLGDVPFLPAVPVNTFWDLGKNDTTSIWLHQQMNMAHRFPYAFENSGEYLPYYVKELQRLQAENDLVYGVHYLPHDAAHDNIRGKPAVQQLRELWKGQTFTVVPRINRVIDGINRTRAVMAGVYIDRKNCADGVAALDAYRKKFDKLLGAYTNEPVHDRFSNFADAFRMFGEGYAPAQHYASAAIPEWKKKLLGMKSHAPRSRNPMAS